jgi:hypothetical protein
LHSIIELFSFVRTGFVMRTRQLRLNDSNQIRLRISEFLGKKINIVLTDGTVMFGELTKIKDSEIIVRNMRLQRITYPFENIAEVYLDTIV